MINLIFDSCSLIYLSKINKLSILTLMSKNILIDEEVYNESVISGKEHGFRDAYILERFIVDHVKIIPQDISQEIVYFNAKGEASTFLLGKNGICVTSDKRAFQKMLKRGNNVIKLEDLLFIYCKKQILQIDQFIQLLKELLQINAISAEKFHILMQEVKK